ncbi:MAG: hypothetical protein DDT28_01188 [Dehalococcoidia bacterium]|nr:hypothetical protein [Chloroflexota bacterium]
MTPSERVGKLNQRTVAKSVSAAINARVSPAAIEGRAIGRARRRKDCNRL